ncbi:MAG: hypothetical protein GON13_03865 [Nanoarchaeota archaeon]|nr:hypothetical protein [Nanoarchaeota archaeon]
MDFVMIIGFIATVIVLSASLPQIIQIWKTKKTRDISLGMYFTLCVGMAAWLFYGILREDIVLITSNTIGFALYASILFLKIKYG